MSRFDEVYQQHTEVPQGWFVAQAPMTTVRGGIVVNSIRVRVTANPFTSWKYGDGSTFMVQQPMCVIPDFGRGGYYIVRHTALKSVRLGRAYVQQE
jgi:hypothetical protein